MKQALRQLLSDFLSAILFLVVYMVSGSLFAAAGIAVAAGLAQLFRLKLTRRRIEPMQWMSLGLVVLLGGATMLTQSPRFMMNKADHRSLCSRQRDVAARLDAPLFAGNGPAECARTYDRGRRLCLGSLARGARARPHPRNRPSFRLVKS